ncbi:MAG: hypothetical protein AAGE94_10635 [Acidobacteriota bacterium]
MADRHESRPVDAQDDPDLLDEAERQALEDSVEAAEEVARGCLGRLIAGIWQHLKRWALIYGLALVVGVPWLVKVNLWVDPNAFTRVDETAVPKPARDAFDQLDATLGSLGFETWGWVRGDTSPGSVTFVGVLADTESRVWGSILSTYTPIAEADGTRLDHSTTAIEFVTPLAEGRRVATSNLAWPKSFDRHAGAIEQRHPEIGDPIALHRHHLDERRAAGVTALDLGSPDDLIAVARQQTAREIDAQVEASLFHVDDDGIYRPTWKGAFLMTYRQLFDVLTDGER